MVVSAIALHEVLGSITGSDKVLLSLSFRNFLVIAYFKMNSIGFVSEYLFMKLRLLIKTLQQ